MADNDRRRDLSITEWPFVREGMTDDEYWTERDYFIHHYEDYKNGSYIPLWEQKNELTEL